MDRMTAYLRPTSTIDCDNAEVREKAQELTGEQKSVTDKAISLFYFVRDAIRYNFFMPSDQPEYYRASRILEEREGFCIQKAVLLVALARNRGIPARLHLAAIRNYLVPDKLRELIKGEVFPTHGYADLYIKGRWIKVAPAFDLKMCQHNRFIPVEFDGQHDAVLPSYNLDGKPHIEYVYDLGYYEDLPFDKIITWRLDALGLDFFEQMRLVIAKRRSE